MKTLRAPPAPPPTPSHTFPRLLCTRTTPPPPRRPARRPARVPRRASFPLCCRVCLSIPPQGPGALAHEPRSSVGRSGDGVVVVAACRAPRLTECWRKAVERKDTRASHRSLRLGLRAPAPRSPPPRPPTMNPQQLAEKEKKGAMLYNSANIQGNMQAVMWVRSFMGIISGVCTGILGLTGAQGFVAFLLLYVVVSIGIISKAGFNLSGVLPGAKLPWFLVDSLMGQLMSFLLFWTMFYGLVHVF